MSADPPPPPSSSRYLPRTSAEVAAVEEWLYAEAEALDDNDLEGWLTLLDPALHYTVPVRETRRRGDGDGVSLTFSHLDEDFASLELRVRRLLETKTAWAEDPPSRTRRLVTNVRVRREGDLLQARSNLLLMRSRGDAPTYELISGERHDALAGGPAALLLRERVVVLDQATLGTVNLAVFL